MISRVIKIKYLFFLLLITSFFIFISNACTSDKLPEPVSSVDCDTLDISYNGLIKGIIENNCALSGCHVRGGGGPGIYTSYSGLSKYLNKNSMERYVIDLRNDPIVGMPPDNSPGPKDLTIEQIDIFKCWINAGYPEN